MDKILTVDIDKCTGCRVCELVCSMTKLGEFNPSKAHIKVMKNSEMDLNLVSLGTGCDFCGECVEWCMPKAIAFVDFDEAVLKWKGVKAGTLPAPTYGS